jgi:outer membrane murein-binding lipoprotein Lpp
MENQVEPIDLNTASLEALQSIPGISLKIAQRIESARPFTAFDDLEQIQGMRKKTLETIRPLITIGSLESAVLKEEPPSISTSEPVLPEIDIEMNPEKAEIVPVEDEREEKLGDEVSSVSPDETDDVIPEVIPAELFQPISEKEPESTAPVGQESIEPQKPVPAVHTSEIAVKKYVTRDNLFWYSAISAILAVILAIFATLGVIGIINGGLRFVRPAQLNAVSTQLERMDSTVGILQDDLLAMQTRLAAVEGLAAQVNQLDKTLSSTVDQVNVLDTQLKELAVTVNDLSSQTDALNTQVEGLSRQADGLRQDVDNLSSAVEELTNRTNVFQKFFDGLKDLVKLFDKP